MFRGEIERSLARAEEGLRRFGDARERWLTSYLHTIIGMSLFHMPGKEMAATAAMGAALRAKYEISDCVGTAYCLEILGWLAARDGRHGRTAWLLGAAAPLWARVGNRLAGTMLLEQHHRDAEAAARVALGDARYAALADEGARRPLDLIVSLAIAGTATLPRETPRVPSTAGLTSREREIAGLVASGLSNRQIAERMSISRRTVAAHVGHIFGKLGISSRIQLSNWLRDGNLSPAWRLSASPRASGRPREGFRPREACLQVAAALLLALDGLEQRLEVALAEAERAVPLDQLEEHRRPVADRLGEDLQQVPVVVPVHQDAPRCQLFHRYPDGADPGAQHRVGVVGAGRGQELHAAPAQRVHRRADVRRGQRQVLHPRPLVELEVLVDL
jgi:DNA-binding CsgD family transcriptional regulator